MTPFITEFGRPLKEGLYQDFANREALLELVRFRTTAHDGMTSLKQYVERMQEDQKAIYYITGRARRPTAPARRCWRCTASRASRCC